MKIDVLTITFDGNKDRLPEIAVHLKEQATLITMINTDSGELNDHIVAIRNQMKKHDKVTMLFWVDGDTHACKLKAKFNLLCSFKCRHKTLQEIDAVNAFLSKIFIKFLKYVGEYDAEKA